MEKNPDVKYMILLGEVGGTEEYKVIDAIKEGKITKPVIAWCIGTIAKHFSSGDRKKHTSELQSRQYLVCRLLLEKNKENLCEDCQRRITQNPIRTLDCKNQNCQAILKDAPKITDNLCENCQKDFEKLQEGLKALNISFEIDKHLVRGLDYYTKTTFEFISNKIGAQSAICGGGRYDRLVEMLGGKPTPGVGFAIGVERIIDLVEVEEKREGIYMGSLIEEAIPFILKKATELREQKVYVEPKIKSLKAHLKAADKGNFEKAMIVGEDELKNGKFFEKNL
jgi:histidyl-tRNA synthetase